ncbi:segregation/condensation protein A [Arthrobacter agilis]|nr:ScpA family protein [Arthrobacter agilis]PPB47008.1 segregation/condensation protein A [Arthrobacter agilis]TPV23395.1 segregation/condensation protein A [Arthrobacter agilis]VDR31773.1 Segregation and condensation protein A [Arthrobacter agilis]
MAAMPSAPAPEQRTTAGALPADGTVTDTGGAAASTSRRPTVFEVQLVNFTGPFDLLLILISRRELDITEIALAQVTDEFIAHIRRIQAAEGEWKLDEASEFLVVAATLLDLKAARLLPAGAVEDEEDIALLEARDLLFARLLQYRAFKEMARHLAERFEEEDSRHAREVPLEPQFTRLLPELVWKHSPEEFAAVAAAVLAPREEKPTRVGIEHLHAPPVSVRDEAMVLQELLTARGPLSFRQLTEDAASRLVLVVRFLALLELFRDGAISFEQAAPLSDLLVRWSAEDERWSAAALSSDFENDSDSDSDSQGDGDSDSDSDGDSDSDSNGGSGGDDPADDAADDSGDAAAETHGGGLG